MWCFFLFFSDDQESFCCTTVTVLTRYNNNIVNTNMYSCNLHKLHRGHSLFSIHQYYIILLFISIVSCRHCSHPGQRDSAVVSPRREHSSTPDQHVITARTTCYHSAASTVLPRSKDIKLSVVEKNKITIK